MNDKPAFWSDWVVYSFYGVTLEIWCQTLKKARIWQNLDLTDCRTISDVVSKYSPSKYPAVKAILNVFDVEDGDYLLSVAEDNTYAFSGNYISFLPENADQYKIVDLSKVSTLVFSENNISFFLGFDFLRKYTCKIKLTDGSMYKFVTIQAVDQVFVSKWVERRKSLLQERCFKKQKEDEERLKKAQENKFNEQLTIARKECPPPDECAQCGECNWKLTRMTTQYSSVNWTCIACGYNVVVKKQINGETVYERREIPRDVRMYVWQRDAGMCVNCGSRERLEYDHIIPVSKGGSNTARNIQLLCEICNRAKGASI